MPAYNSSLSNYTTKTMLAAKVHQNSLGGDGVVGLQNSSFSAHSRERDDIILVHAILQMQLM